jgi:hypothetical protein
MDIICGTGGRLGNQMFCLAAAYKIAKDYNANVIGYRQIEGQEPSDYIKHTVLKKCHYISDSKILENALIYPPKREVCYGNEFKLPICEKIVLYDAFQDMKFIDREICYNLFGAYDDIKKEIKSIYGDLEEYVCVQVRRTDYIPLQCVGFKVLDKKYIMENLEKYYDKSKVLMISDDIEWCKYNFRGEGFVFRDKPCRNDIEFDLYIQTLCGQGNLISNSTFGWWGAFLNESPTKKVVVSYPWFNYNALNGLRGIVPSDWIKVEN